MTAEGIVVDDRVRFIRTDFLGNQCPFRGGAFRPELDERCPTTVKAFITPVNIAPSDHKPIWMGAGTPAVHEDSYCGGCLTGRIREQEAGIDMKTGEFTKGRKKRKSKKEGT